MRLAAPLTALLMLSACGDGGDTAAPDQAAAPAPAVTDAEKQARLVSLPAPYNAADLANGQRKFAMCRSCHTLTEDGASMTGPNLHEVFGEKAGHEDHYKYSDALKASGITWDAATLDRWIENPRAMVPGTKMAFAGVKDPKDRIDLIGYLMAEAGAED